MKAAVKALKAKGGNAFGADVDVADKAALQKYIADSAAALGGIDILVANVSALAVQDDEESWSKTFDVDMMHTVQCGQRRPALSRKIKTSLDRHHFLGLGARGRFYRTGLRRR